MILPRPFFTSGLWGRWEDLGPPLPPPKISDGASLEREGEFRQIPGIIRGVARPAQPWGGAPRLQEGQRQDGREDQTKRPFQRPRVS